MLNLGLRTVLRTASKSGSRCPGFYAGSAAGRCPCGRSRTRYGLGVRNHSQEAARDKLACYQLTHRTLLKIQGPDTGPFLQGLITNDVAVLEEPSRRVMYCHMLSVQGRTLFDVMLYSLKSADVGSGVLLECDSSMKDSLLKHLKVYRIRRKITLDACPELSLWAVLTRRKTRGEEVSDPQLSSSENTLICEPDPRTQDMGWRLVLDKHVDPLDVLESCQKGDLQEYHKHRYTIGLPEGVKDLPPGVALPLESNLVDMQGISFSKGCYIGQELTARTHHTGVVRKRLMPVRLSVPVHDIEEGAALQTQSGKPAGKYRSGVGELALGLVRLAHAKEPLTLRSSSDDTVSLQAVVPDWWSEDVKVN
ncbi:putative transferase CAF17 homolog, mitochondrial [Neosynchiropus ocellatus]